MRERDMKERGEGEERRGRGREFNPIVNGGRLVKYNSLL